MTKSYDFKVVHDGEWKVDCNGDEYGPYASRRIAVEAANAAASIAARHGLEASVLISPAA